MRLFGFLARWMGRREHRAVEEKISELETQSGEIRDHLDTLAARPDPFAALVRTMRQAAIQRRRENGVEPGHPL